MFKKEQNKMPLLGKRYTHPGPFHDYVANERLAARNAILQEIVPAGELIQIPCLCGVSDEDVLLASIDRWGIPSSHVLCRRCGLLRVTPRWDDDTYSKIYAVYFWSLQAGQHEITGERFELSVERAAPFASYLVRQVDLRGKRVLELGCSYGAGLTRLNGLGSAVMVGYDWDPRILELGRQYSGLDLRRGGVNEAIAEADCKYDVVILRHVFEHLLYPFDEGLKLKDLIGEDGLVFLEVPGVLNESEWTPDPIAFFNAFHVYSYCLRTLSRVMERCGFELVHGDEHVYSLWKKTDVKCELPWESSDGSQDVLAFIRRMERLRKLRQSIPGRLWNGLRAIFKRC
jgi:SAM-dependent methyltransferase